MMKKKVMAIVLAICVACGTLAFFTGCSEEEAAGNGEVDIDLTKMNTTVAYAKITEMYQNPKNYVGKKVKIRGGYLPYFAEDLNKSINYVTVISEVCCARNVDLKWDGDFPQNENDMIEVVGVFESHNDYLGYGTLYRLKVEDLKIL